METLAFNANQASRHNPYMDTTFRGIGSEISRNYANNMGILNAESYPDVLSTGGYDERKKGSEPMLSFGMIPRPHGDLDSRGDEEEPDTGTKRRKKPRIEVHSGDDEEAKKSRGRPRVDTKDETAADRRRTQIRMAQRAYRHRKETTISSLEKQVQELRGTNEEMSNIFISLYDFAVGKGLLQREPEFGQQLQSTTERNPKKHEEPESDRPKKKGRKSSPKTRQEKKAATPESKSPVWGGFPLGEQARAAVEEIRMDYQPQNYESRSRQQDLQVITRPTEDNASFPWDFMDLQQYNVNLPSTEDFSQVFLPESQLPLPDTHSYTENSFARRLQRGAVEAAWQLVTNPSPPPGVFERVFGFCLTYESRESIIDRTKRQIRSSSKDSLQNWRAPFINVGRAGTFYPLRDGGDELMPKLRTGYSMGPFTEAIAQTQDEFLDESMRCNIPGFEGEFFDANDVEGYLRGRGLDISSSADLVTAHLDLSLVEASPKSTSGSTVSTVSPRTPRSPLADLLTESNGLSNAYKLDLNALPFPLGFASWDDDVSGKDTSNIDPIFYTTTEENSGRASPNFAGSGSLPGERRTVTLNVQTLLSEIIKRGVCLGPTYTPPESSAATSDDADPTTMESDLSGLVFIPGLTEQQRLNPEPRKSRFIEHFDQDNTPEYVLYVIPEEQESINSLSIPTSKQPVGSAANAGNSYPKNALHQPKAHQRPVPAPTRTDTTTLKQSPESLSATGFPRPKPRSDKSSALLQGANNLTLQSRIHYLRRLQMEAALKNLAIQDANVDAGKTTTTTTTTTTTKTVSETVTTPNYQSPSRSTSSAEKGKMAESLPVSASPVMCNQGPFDLPLAGIPPTPAEGTHEVSRQQMLKRLHDFKQRGSLDL
ncbi:hypothetical protein LSUB1_G006838 [Lachnellula subtilissima]|uniref:BZIP domain-containing protein n=1 Tax=Lachnellula subtilissima TaxID=602034 RepID=A0A8H8U4H5_9HELO|nr:hypothetical protein LSUB1_G006838 [Lachnellula subtilissima]